MARNLHNIGKIYHIAHNLRELMHLDDY